MAKRVNIKEASQITGLSVYALRKGVKEGRFPAIRVGSDISKLLFDMGQLEEALTFEAIDNMQIPAIKTGEELQ